MVDCGGLENRCTARYPGFESLSLRNNFKDKKNYKKKQLIMGKEKYNKEELIRLLIHEGKSYKEVAAMRGDGSTGEAIRKAANRYGIKVSDRKKLRKCEYCGKEHDGSFGSGRFCCSDCAKKYSLSFSKGKKPEDKSTKEEKVEESVKIAPPKECTTELSRFDGKLTSDLLGYVGECATMFQLARVGIMSSKPCGVDRYDVIADIGGILYKIQVKSTAGYIDKDGALSYNLQNKSGLYKKGEVDFFGNPNQLQKPKVINSSSSNKGGNSSISSLDAKRMNLKRYNSHKTRSLEVTPTAPGQNEWVKRVKTNGQARWENNGLYIPGFEKL